MPYFFRKLGKMLQNLSSATVVIGALRVNYLMAILMLNLPDRKTKTKAAVIY